MSDSWKTRYVHPQYKELALQLLNTREQLGMSRTAAAKSMGVTPPSLYGWEQAFVFPTDINYQKVQRWLERHKDNTDTGLRAKCDRFIKGHVPTNAFLDYEGFLDDLVVFIQGYDDSSSNE